MIAPSYGRGESKIGASAIPERHETGCEPRQSLHFGRYNNFRGFSVRDFLHGFQRFQFDHLIVRRGGVQQFQRIRQRGLHLLNSLRFRFGGENPRLFLTFRFADRRLFFPVRFQNRRLFLALRDTNLRFFLTFRL